MLKELLIEKTKHYIEQNNKFSNLEAYSKNSKLFLINLKQLEYHQINKILTEHPNWANTTQNGVHSLFYAIKKNDYFIMNLFLEVAVKNGLTELPKKNTKNKHIFLTNECNKHDYIQSFLSILNKLNLTENDFKTHYLNSIIYDSHKIRNFLNDFLTIEERTELFLKSFSNETVFENILKNGKYSLDNIELFYNLNISSNKKHLNLFIGKTILNLYEYSQKLYEINEEDKTNKKEFYENIIKLLDNLSLFPFDLNNLNDEIFKYIQNEKRSFSYKELLIKITEDYSFKHFFKSSFEQKEEQFNIIIHKFQNNYLKNKLENNLDDKNIKTITNKI